MYDLIVIGAGSGGLVAAKRAASYQKKVLLCENDTIGGTCVSFGCVPKKLWHTIAHFSHDAKKAADHGWQLNTPTFNWKDAQSSIAKYIRSLNNRHESKCMEQNVTIIKGTASFINKTTISVNNKQYSAKHILIAVGSKATRLDIDGANHCDTSYEFFNWKQQPKTVGIIGGGYIAVELASILNALGTKTHIIIRKEYVLRGFDNDMRRVLQDAYKKRGITIHQTVEPKAIKHQSGQFTIELSNDHSIKVDKVLQCVGRQANTAELNCENAGIKCSNTGAIIVDDSYQSSTSNIYALGDCIDREQLTPVAIAQARQWVDSMYAKIPFKVSFQLIPTAIFSLPEGASIGLSEDEANKLYSTVTTKTLIFNPLTTALTQQHKEPVLMKLILKDKTESVIGIHIVGDGAAEIIQSLSVAMQKGITKHDLDATMALHPTVTEELVTIY